MYVRKNTPKKYKIKIFYSYVLLFGVTYFTFIVNERYDRQN
jgi:hypothetical protein